MARRLTREENTEQTRRRLLAAAQEVFLERGFHAASLEAVAERAGFTKGAVYSRFGSKADLFLALLAERGPATVREVAALANDAESGEELLDTFRRYWTARLNEGPAWSLVLMEFWTSAGRDRALRERFRELHEQLLRGVAKVIDEAAARLGLVLSVPSLDLVRATTALGRGLALERLVDAELVSDDVIAWAFDALASTDASLAPTGVHPLGRKVTS